MSTELQHAIEAAFSGDTPAEDARGAVEEAIARLDRGELSLAEQQADGSSPASRAPCSTTRISSGDFAHHRGCRIKGPRRSNAE